jgi:GGDEF domain-containing protein
MTAARLRTVIRRSVLLCRLFNSEFDIYAPKNELDSHFFQSHSMQKALQLDLVARP